MTSKLTEHEIEILEGVVNLEINILELNDEEVTYEVKNVPLCEFDQHSRARIGVKFFDYQVSEKPVYVFYTRTFNLLESDEKFAHNTFDILDKLEAIRENAEFKTSYNLMSRCCSYKVKQTFTSLKGQMSRRLKFCEEEFICGLHFLLRDKLINLKIELANNFLPSCDNLKRCDYSSADYLSNMFGCLFSGCGRWKDESGFATFNESCTNIKELELQLGIQIPKSEHEISLKNTSL